jgi:hypothetical protein
MYSFDFGCRKLFLGQAHHERSACLDLPYTSRARERFGSADLVVITYTHLEPSLIAIVRSPDFVATEEVSAATSFVGRARSSNYRRSRVISRR